MVVVNFKLQRLSNSLEALEAVTGCRNCLILIGTINCQSFWRLLVVVVNVRFSVTCQTVGEF